MNKQLMFLKRALWSCFYIFVFFIFVSCVTADLSDMSKDVKLTQSVLLPIGTGSTTLADILEGTNWEENYYSYNADSIVFHQSKQLEFLYDGTNILKNATPGNISFSFGNYSVTVPANTTIPIPGGNNVSINLGLDPSSTNDRTDSVRVSNISMNLKFDVSGITDVNGIKITPSDLKINVVFPQLVDTILRNQISKSITSYTFGNNYVLSIDRSILNLVGQTSIPVRFTLTTGSRPVKVNSNASMSVGYSITNFRYWIAYGIYNQIATKSFVHKIPLDFLNDFPANLKFADAKLKISVSSNIGTYMLFNIESLKAYYQNNLVYQSTFNGSPTISVDVAQRPVNPGQYITVQLPDFDNSNGNISELISTDKKKDTLICQYFLSRNIARNSASGLAEFVLPKMSAKINADIKVPMYFRAGTNYTRIDTVNIGDDNKDFDKIEKGIIRLLVTNGFPVKIMSQFTFLDASNHPLDFTFTKNKTYEFQSADVNSQGLVVKPNVTTLDITSDKDDAQKIKSIKKMIYSISISGQDASKSIQFTKKDSISIKVGLFGKIGYRTNF